MAGGDRQRAGRRLAPRRTRARRRPRALRGRRVLARPGRRGARAARDAARQPVPRPARPLRRARDDRRPLGRDRRRAAGAALVLNADDPLVADLGRHAPNPVYFGVDDDSLALPELQHACDSKHCRRCGHAYVYEAVYLAHLGHYHCPNCGQQRPEPSVVATDVELRGITSAAFTLDGGARGRAPAPRPLQRLQRARRRRADAARSASRSTTSSPAWRRSRPPSAAPRRSTSAAAPPRSCWSRTRPAPTRCCARSRSRTASSTCFGVLNDRIADGRDVSLGLGRRLGAARRPRAAHDVLGHARGGAGAADEVRGPGRRARPRRRRPRGRRSTRRSPTATGPLYVVPTYTALLELRELLTAPRPGGGVLAMSARGRGLARRRVRRLRRRPGALARARRRGAGGRARRRRRHGPRRARLAAAGHDGDRARPRRPSCWRRSSERAARRASRVHDRAAPTRATSRSPEPRRR